ncbi:MAG: response regulator [Magnetococcales bacterium]|nr:response regulator [Magnetococcales bacterium]
MELNQLLELILTYAKELTRSDAGTLYLVVEKEFLKFEIVRTDSLGICLGGTAGVACTFPLISLYHSDGTADYRSIVSSCVLKKQIISIEDAYSAIDYDFSKTRQFDRKNGYRTRSCLTVPLMIQGEEPVGAIQLINALDETSGEVAAFSKEDESLTESLASQATLAIKSHRLHAQIKKQLIHQGGIVEIHRLATSHASWQEKLEGMLHKIVEVIGTPACRGCGLFIPSLKGRNGNPQGHDFSIGMDSAQIEACRQMAANPHALAANGSSTLPPGHFRTGIDRENTNFGMIYLIFDGQPDSHRESIDFVRTVGAILAGVLECEYGKELIAGSERYLETILDNALAGILVIDASGRIVKANAAARKMFGYTAQAWQEVVAGSLLSQLNLQPVISSVIQGESPTDHEGIPVVQRRLHCACIGADSRQVFVDMGLVTALWRDEIRITVFLNDITAEKHLLKSLQDTVNVAEMASKAKSAFLANMSHEIRSPMNAIIGMTDLVLTTSLPREEERSYLNTVMNAGLSLLDLINDILDISKIEAGHMVLETIPFDLCGRIEDVCEIMAVKAHQKALELFCDVDWDLPDTLIGDPLRLKQIMINLINNAIKFTADGFIAVRVEKTKASEDDLVLHLSVADTGIGIPEDKKEIIFQDFTQVDDSTSRKFGGTGLGLGISKHLVHMMGGEVWVESTLGEGSTFHFTISFGISQREDNCRSTSDKEEERQQGNKPVAPLLGVRVLIVGGYPLARCIIARTVAGFGGTSEQAADTVALLSRLKAAQAARKPYDALLLDETLLREDPPRLEIFESGSAFRGVPIVLLPSNMSLSTVTGATWLKESLPLKKPVRRFQLLNAINQVLGRKGRDEKQKVNFSIKPRPDKMPLQILLIDDLETNQRLATSILQQAGHFVTLANHGGEALQILREGKQPFDLLLMDLQMPTMDGFETTLRIREAAPGEIPDPRVPIVAVTACAMASEEGRCKGIGMNGYLRKPYRPIELIQTIEPFLKPRIVPVKKVSLDPLDVDRETLALSRGAFRGEIGELVKGLRHALECRNGTHLVQGVAKLAVLAIGVGAKRINNQAIRLKSSAEAGDWEDVAELLERLDEQVAQALELLDGDMAGH